MSNTPQDMPIVDYGQSILPILEQRIPQGFVVGSSEEALRIRLQIEQWKSQQSNPDPVVFAFYDNDLVITVSECDVRETHHPGIPWEQRWAEAIEFDQPSS